MLRAADLSLKRIFFIGLFIYLILVTCDPFLLHGATPEYNEAASQVAKAQSIFSNPHTLLNPISLPLFCWACRNQHSTCIGSKCLQVIQVTSSHGQVQHRKQRRLPKLHRVHIEQQGNVLGLRIHEIIIIIINVINLLSLQEQWLLSVFYLKAFFD